LENEKEVYYKSAIVKAGKALKTQEEKLKERIRNNRMYTGKLTNGIPKDIAA